MLLLPGAIVIRRFICRLHLLRYAPVAAWTSHRSTSYIARYQPQWVANSLDFKAIGARCVSGNSAELVTSSSIDRLTESIISSQSASELLDVLRGFGISSFTPAQSCLFNRRLVDLHYESLCRIHPWLQSNIHIAHIQLELYGNNLRWSSAEPVHTHKAYLMWRDLINDHIEEYSPSQLTEALISVLYLGVFRDDCVLVKLLCAMCKRMPEFDCHALLMSTIAMKTSVGLDYMAIRMVMKRYVSLLNEMKSLTGDELAAMASVSFNVARFMNAELVLKAINWMTAIIEEDRALLNNPNHLANVIRVANRFNRSTFANKSSVLRLINIGIDVCYDTVDEFNSGNIAEICTSLKLSRSYDRELAGLCQKRALRLLDDDCRLCEVANLMHSLTSYAPVSVLKTFVGSLHARLARCEDVDIVILSNVADILNGLAKVDTELLSLFQKRVVARADHVIQYASRYDKIIKQLAQNPFVDRELEAQFVDRLVAEIEQEDGMHIFNLAQIAYYLMPSTSSALPSAFFNHLLAAMPRWHIRHILKLTNGINCARYPRSAEMWRQHRQIYSALHTVIGNRLDQIQSMDHLYQITLAFVANNRYRDPTLTDKLMGSFTRYSGCVNDDLSIVKIAHLFHQVQYYLPQVYEDMTNYILNSTTGRDSKVLSVIAACALVGYQPQRGEELLQLAKVAYHNIRKRRDYAEMLPLLLRLIVMQLYPEDELASLFTLESIEDIERYMADNPQYTATIESHLMQLNRSVVLECPQLGVPWFHEQYCVDNIVKPTAGELNQPDKDFQKFHHEVYSTLSEVLGGGHYLQKNVFTPYYYKLDFECTLDKNKKPVVVRKWSKQNSNALRDLHQWQRVAIHVLPKSAFCYNSKQPKGYMLLRKRHLEIMDYKVVEIPYFDWFSMGLTDHQRKLDYIRSKVTS